MKPKVIGIPGWMLNDGFGVRTPYIDYTARFGTPLILTPQHGVEDIDLLLLPGGADVAATRYDVPSYHIGGSNQMLEWFDMHRLPGYIEKSTPVVGICRGLQSVIVHFNGKLTQHLYDSHDTSTYPTQEAHDLKFVDKYTQWAKSIGKVNSRHHQCADPENIPDCFEVVAYAKEKTRVREDIPEIIVHKDKNIYLIQSHPEDQLSSDGLTPWIIEQYLNK